MPASLPGQYFVTSRSARFIGRTSAAWETRYMKGCRQSTLRTWQLNDVGATPGFGGSMQRALTSIKAKASVMASQTDLYFRLTDMKAEAVLIPGAKFRVIPSLWAT
jgi:homoserine acetyltransferase